MMLNGRYVILLASEDNNGRSLTVTGQQRLVRTTHRLHRMGLVPSQVFSGTDLVAQETANRVSECFHRLGSARPTVRQHLDLDKDLRVGEHIVSRQDWRQITAEADKTHRGICDLLHQGNLIPEVLHARAMTILQVARYAMHTQDTTCLMVVAVRGRLQHAVAALIKRRSVDHSFRIQEGEVCLLEALPPSHRQLSFRGYLGGLHTPEPQLILPGVGELRTLLAHAPKA